MNSNIVRISGSYHPAKSMGGATTADYEIDQEFTNLGYTVDVLTTLAGLNCTPEKPDNINSVKYFRIFFNFNFFISPTLIVYFLYKCVFSKSFRRSFFIFSGTWGITNLVIVFFCILFNAKYSIVPHGSLYEELVNNKRKTIKKILTPFVKLGLNKAKFVHYTVMQEKLSSKWIHSNSENALVVPLGFDFSKFYLPTLSEVSDFKAKYKVSDDEVIILFVGRVNWKKGLDKTLCNLPDDLNNSNYRFFVVGPVDDGYLEELKDTVGLKNFKKMEYLGPLYGSELSIAYSSSDIFILTSYSENFAMTIVEASFYKNAIIMTKEVGVSNFYNKDNAIICNSDNDIKEGIKRLLEDKFFLLKLKNNSQVLSQRFSVKETTILLSRSINA